MPLGYDFTLYKHGPFSFDLRDDIHALRADGLLDLEPRPPTVRSDDRDNVSDEAARRTLP